MEYHEVKVDLNKVFLYVISAIVAICSWLITTSYNNFAKQLSSVSAELVEVKLELVSVKASMLDEEKVKNIVETELLKRGIK